MEYVHYSALATKTQKDDEFCIDSGAAKHMTRKDMDMEDIRKPLVSEVQLANDNTIKINHLGNLKCELGDSQNSIILKDKSFIGQ